MKIELNRLSPPAWCALIAAIGGLLSGATAVHGLRQNQYGPSNPPSLIQNSAVVYESVYTNGGHAEGSTTDCQGCSERDLGYRWATLAQVHSSDQCPNDSWGFRRGCLDYTGGI